MSTSFLKATKGNEKKMQEISDQYILQSIGSQPVRDANLFPRFTTWSSCEQMPLLFPSRAATTLKAFSLFSCFQNTHLTKYGVAVIAPSLSLLLGYKLWDKDQRRTFCLSTHPPPLDPIAKFFIHEGKFFPWPLPQFAFEIPHILQIRNGLLFCIRAAHFCKKTYLYHMNYAHKK